MNWNPMMGPLPGLFAGQQFKENQLGAGVTLGVQGVVVLLQPFLGALAGVDGAADRLGR